VYWSQESHLLREFALVPEDKEGTDVLYVVCHSCTGLEFETVGPVGSPLLKPVSRYERGCHFHSHLDCHGGSRVWYGLY